ncbi:sigma-70 family RNA polymerase sigma factor [Nostocoides vanveenii]|uniref:sigma-70 family RNA polymerase sigma factor n=1 Tax=Nostocoides vanveenii TaxID=330835 RepID=UPI0031CF28A1
MNADPGRVAEFARANGQALLRFAYLLTGGRGAEAEDLVQGVLATLVERGLNGIADPLAYARRAVVNAHRSQARRGIAERAALPRLVERDPGPDRRSEDRAVILPALEALSPDERAVVILRYYADLPDEEIAAVLGCARATVRSHAHRAMTKLRRELGEDERN